MKDIGCIGSQHKVGGMEELTRPYEVSIFGPELGRIMVPVSEMMMLW